MSLSSQITVVHADVRDFLTTVPDDYFSGVLSDGPYGIGITQNLRLGSSNWDSSSITFDPDFWKSVHRVLRPGATIAAWGHSRTAHRQAVAMEAAGFRILDQIMHVKAHGFTPGSRPIDKELTRLGLGDLANEYEGYTTHIKSSHEPITIAAKLGRRTSIVRTIADGGSGGFNTGSLLIPTDDASRSRTPGRVSPNAAWSVARPAIKSVPRARGRLPTNVVFTHAETCTPSSCSEDCALHLIDTQGRRKYRGERASRFFSSLRYAPRAPATERPTSDGGGAPTVKNQEIATWVATLLGVREGTKWLDPFGGSGALSEAIARLGGEVVYVERESTYCEMAGQRFSRMT